MSEQETNAKMQFNSELGIINSQLFHGIYCRTQNGIQEAPLNPSEGGKNEERRVKNGE